MIPLQSEMLLMEGLPISYHLLMMNISRFLLPLSQDDKYFVRKILKPNLSFPAEAENLLSAINSVHTLSTMLFYFCNVLYDTCVYRSFLPVQDW